MRETHFQQEWHKSWVRHHPSAHMIKIPDMPRTSDTRFNPVKPYDFYCFDGGVFFAMELKLQTHFGVFPFRAVTEGQLRNLLSVETNSGISLVVINYRIAKASKKAKKDWGIDDGFNVSYVMKGSTFDGFDRNMNSKNIPVDVLFHDPGILCLKWLPANEVWDMEPLFSAVRKGW